MESWIGSRYSEMENWNCCFVDVFIFCDVCRYIYIYTSSPSLSFRSVVPKKK